MKDKIVYILTIGILSMLTLVIIGDMIIAYGENRPLDESIVTLIKMSLTGLIGIIAGYFGGKSSS